MKVPEATLLALSAFLKLMPPERLGVKPAFRKTTPVWLFVALSLTFCWASRAHAHASLVRTEPASGTAVNSPQRIDLWFDELLEDHFNSVQVIPVSQITTAPRDQKNLTRGAVELDPKDRTHLTASLAPLQPGEYVVRWRVLSRDGHSAPGQFEFRVTGNR